ncbi:MAG: hypothetical protein LAP86_27915 [Acidobacteriia bacterium]|nr:hypothetical protein [Terriglobia bacterium]
MNTIPRPEKPATCSSNAPRGDTQKLFNKQEARGIVWGVHMQDPTISSDLKALIAVVSTYPANGVGWIWRGSHLRKVLGWGESKYKLVMHDAKARGFVTITRVNKRTGFEYEYSWDLRSPSVENQPMGPSVENPMVGKPHGGQINPHKKAVGFKKAVRGNEPVEEKPVERCSTENRSKGDHEKDARSTPFLDEKKLPVIPELIVEDSVFREYRAAADERFFWYKNVLSAEWPGNWGKRDDIALARVLHDHPKWAMADLNRALDHYRQSEWRPGAPRSHFLAHATEYWASPVAQYGRSYGAVALAPVEDDSIPF